VPENITPFIYNSSSVRESEIPSNGEKVGKEEHQEDILLEAVDVQNPSDGTDGDAKGNPEKGAKGNPCEMDSQLSGNS